MYRVTLYNGSTATIIHEPSVATSDPHLYTCSLVQGSSGEIDTLSFDILPNNPGYELLASRTTMVTVYNTATGKNEFSGRVLTITPQMDSSGLIYKSVVCEDRLGFLCDSIQPYTAEATYALEVFFKKLLENHNSQVEDYKKIYPGTISATASASTGNVTKGLNYETTWEALNSKLLDTEGGEIQLYEGTDGLLYLDYVDELGSISDTTIELGKNMTSISQEIDSTDIITRLIPLGANLEADEDDEDSDVDTNAKTTIASVNNGTIWLDDEEAQAVYGIVVGTVEWEDVTEPSNLLTKGNAWLASQTLTDKVTLTALDLSIIGLEPEAIERYNYYRTINAAIGLDAYLRIVKRTVNICDPSDITFEMGERNSSLAATLTGASNTAGAAAADAVAAINGQLSKTVTALIVSNATIVQLQSTLAEIETAYITTADVETLLAGYAYITTADVESLLADYASITMLDAATANISSLSAEVANINSLLSGNIGAGTVQTIHLSADNTVIDEAVIETIYAANGIISDLTAGTIYTDSVQIANNEGQNLWIDGATIQINDGTHVRVQIGEDASGDYNLYLWNANGVLIWDALGLTEAGLTGNGAIIKDAAVADDAAISGYKLDIASVASYLNEDGSLVVDAANVTINDSTLAAEYVTITTATNEAVAAAEAAANVAETAQTTADNAATAAANAQADADAAATAASNAASNAAVAQSTADDAATAAAAAQATADAAASDLTQAQADLQTALDNYAALSAQADATDEELAAAQDAIAAAQSALNTAQATADAATTAAATAQSTAESAQADADAAATAAADAAVAAANAQTTADSAASAAASAQSLADALASGTVTAVTQYYALGDSADEPPCDPSEGAERAAALVGEAIVGESLVEVTETSSTWTTAYQAPADGEYLWTAFLVTYYDGTEEWTEPACLTDGVARTKTTTLETELAVVQGQISAKVWQTDIDTAVSTLEGEITTIQDQYSTVTQTIGGITAEIGDISTTVGENYSELSSSIAVLTATADEITASVSNYQSQVDGLETSLNAVSASLALTIQTDSDGNSYGAISANASYIIFEAGQLIINAGNFTLDGSGNIVCASGTVGGFTLTKTQLLSTNTADAYESTGENIGDDDEEYTPESYDETNVTITTGEVDSINILSTDCTGDDSAFLAVAVPTETDGSYDIANASAYILHDGRAKFTEIRNYGTLRNSGSMYTSGSVFLRNHRGIWFLNTSGTYVKTLWLNYYDNMVLGPKDRKYGLYLWGSNIYANDIRVPEIQRGSVSITPSAANTPTGKEVTFSSEFSGTPCVVATPATAAPGTTVTGVGTGSPSQTKVTIYVTRANTAATDIRWIAAY